MKERVSIKNKYGKKLSAIIEGPEGDIKDFVIISHCFTCSKLYKLYNNISEFLAEMGYGVVRYDAMGLGDSEGDFSKTSFSTNVDDLISVHSYISEHYKSPAYLFGHSIGGLVSIKASNGLESIKGVVTVGSPYNFDNLINVFSNYESALKNQGSLEVKLGGRSINIGMEYLQDVRDENLEETIKKFNKSIIMFQSDTDMTVGYNDGLKLFNSIKSQKSFITLRNVDHLAGEKADSKYIGNILYSWLENN